MRCKYSLQESDLTASNIDILHVTHDRSFRISYRNGRNKHRFLYAVSGALSVYPIGDPTAKYVITSGELLFIPKGIGYTVTYDADQTRIKIIQFDLMGEAFPDYLSAISRIDLPYAGERINELFSPTVHHTVRHPFYYLSCLYHLLWQIDECYTKRSGKYRRLEAALYELSDRYDQSEPVAYYADLCGMSEVTFRRLFREYTGKSPIDYRNDLRLADAQAKLRSGEYNVSEAAEQCGFSNLSFFIRLYKRKFGHTPKKE